MITIYDIAKKTGFSISTVSKVLNKRNDVSEKTKKIINEAVTELGYLPSSNARSLSTKKSWTIGVVFVEDAGNGLEHPFFNAVIENFKKTVEIEGYDLLFASRKIGKEKRSYLDHFMYRGVDGVVVVCSSHTPELQRLINSDIPSVVIDLDTRGVSVVYSDNFHGAELAVDHLISLGHEKIAHISGHKKLYVGEERLQGYKQTMKKHDLFIPDEYIVDGGYFTYEGGKAAMERLLAAKDTPTAVFVAGDLMAIGAMAAIYDAGLTIPDDISIVGFDDIQIAEYVHPALTTIRQDTKLIGKTAATLIMDQMANKKKAHMSVKIPVSLVTRRSCRERK
ncbi:LacI family DNA-binding transcriptional regulator [Shouchella miscanthi]|uniref:LacI family DNA-binding transcriptional regulator n=1 Tax=Shouchella miscanthi TaxID=2598861 RepID=A0ABU6NK78_9BACI|nr:LacI family DNA-binding transcriptional regulator [Shouchella miscanthi]